MSVLQAKHYISLWVTMLCCALMIMPAQVSAQAFQTRATAAYVIDQTTGTVLLDKDSGRPMPPASMSKLMTIYMSFEAIAEGRLRIDEKLPVSRHASAYTGSSMFLDTTDRVKVEDLLRGVIILSGNDASAVLAEALSPDGSEAGFARYMTRRAQDMGLHNSTFANSNGWPAAGHRMSMRDLAILAERLIADYPTFYPLFSEREFLFDGRVPANSQNRNPLLELGIGADGLKTGHTQEAGYGLVGSAKQGERRVIFAITGLQSAQARAEEAEKIVNWAFRQFAQRDVFDAGAQIAEAKVWMGDQTSIGLTVPETATLLVPALSADTMKAEAVFNSPLVAPLGSGEQVGELVITFKDLPEKRLPLVTQAAVGKGGFEARMRTAIEVLRVKWASDTEADPGADPAQPSH
jgi:D-alanyl-D-alanine carboxypeptidase (penicillin-binding protein 5/6)